MEQQCLGGLAPESLEIRAAGMKWHALEWNPAGGRNILLLHGVTSDARAWWRIGPELAAQNARVVALDMPGHGQTENVAANVQWATTAAQVAQVIEALEWDRAGYRLVGHSWGGVVGLHVARLHGAGLTRLGLLDPALHLRPERVVASSPKYAAEIGQPKLSWQEYYDWSKVNNAEWPDDCDHFWKAGAMQTYDPTLVRDFWLHNSNQSVIGWLGELAITVLLLVGDEEAGGILSAQDQADCRAVMPLATSQMIRLAGAGHNLQRQAYDATMERLKPFLLAD